MFWYAAYKEPGLHPVIDEPDMLYPKSMSEIKSGPGLPPDADQWPPPKVEDEERKARQKVVGLQEWMSGNLEYLRANPVRYKALQELLKRFERRLRRLKELKDALVR